MLLCIIAADLQEAVRGYNTVLFAKIINVEALWCVTSSPAIELVRNCT